MNTPQKPESNTYHVPRTLEWEIFHVLENGEHILQNADLQGNSAVLVVKVELDAKQVAHLLSCNHPCGNMPRQYIENSPRSST
jgi:hypothetical protein